MKINKILSALINTCDTNHVCFNLFLYEFLYLFTFLLNVKRNIEIKKVKGSKVIQKYINKEFKNELLN